MKQGNIGLENYNDFDEQLQPCSFDIHLGKEMLEYRNVEGELVKGKAGGAYNDLFEIIPGCFYLGTTQERLKLGNHIGARIEGKSSIGRRGIVVHCSAGFIDPGFAGELTLEIFSVMPCIQILKPGQKIAQISFFQLSSPCERPYSKERGSHYMNQKGPTPAKY